MTGMIKTFVTCLLLSLVASAQPPIGDSASKSAIGSKRQKPKILSENKSNDLKRRVEELEHVVEQLDANIDVLKEQQKLVIRRSTLWFRDETYAKAGGSLVVPRSRTFSFRTDTGLGAYVGMGQYFGRNHVADLAFEWDIYPSLTLRYRYEFHHENPDITWGPVIGVKIRMAEIAPFDNFLDQPNQLKSMYTLFGIMLGFPMSRSLATLELLYVSNFQAFLFSNVGIHFFFL